MHKFFLTPLFAFIFSFNCLKAEILEIAISWNALLCLNVCVPTLQQELSYIPNVSDIQINSRSGNAVMRWKPNYPFSYEPFNLATRTVGIRISDFRIRVRGTIRHQQDNFYLVSEGDNTQFLLIGPILAEPGRYIIKHNIATHPLSIDLRRQLQIISANQNIVEIEGPLFEPSRYWLVLEVEQLKVSEEDSMNPKYNLL